jgi:hypothetical protein
MFWTKNFPGTHFCQRLSPPRAIVRLERFLKKEIWFCPDSCETTLQSVGLEAFTAVTMENAVFWIVEPCGFIINRRFGLTCRLNPQLRV